MARLNLPITLKLIKDGVDSGIDKTKSAIRGLRLQVSALAATLTGGALAFGTFVSTLREVARETNRARIALKNVSKTMSEFAESERWLIELGNKYGQSINTLEASFAKFLAAARGAGVGIDSVKEIFQGLTQSVSAFGLSSSDANLAFLAVEQMMGKGVVSAEELRRQLGERIPTAMTAMARAVGEVYGTDGTIQSLQDMLKKGAINSAEIMPIFTKKLAELSGTPDTDNLETSYTRLGNRLREIVEQWGLVDKIKWVVDSISKFLGFLKDNLYSFAGFIAGTAFSGKIKRAFASIFNAKETQVAALQAELEKERAIYEASVKAAEQAEARLQKDVFTAQSRLSSVTPRKGDLSYIETRNKRILQAQEKHTAQLRAIEERYAQQVKAIHTQMDASKLNAKAREAQRQERLNSALLAKEQATAKAREALSSKVATHQAQIEARQLQMAEYTANRRAQYAERLAVVEQRAQEQSRASQERLQKAHNAVMEREEALSLARRKTAWHFFAASLRTIMASIKAAFRAMLSATVFGAIFAALGWIVEKVTAWFSGLNKVKNVQEEIASSIANSSYTAQIVELERLQRKYNDLNGKEQERLAVQKEIEKALGGEQIQQENINKAISDRIALLKQQATVEAYKDAVVSAKAELIPYETEQKRKYKQVWVQSASGGGMSRGATYERVTTEEETAEFKKATANYDRLTKALEEEEKKLKALQPQRGASDKGQSIASLREEIDEISKQIEQIDINADGAREAINKLVKEREEKQAVIDRYVGKTAGKTAKSSTPKSKETDPLAEAEASYIKSLQEQANLHSAGRITAEQLREAESSIAKEYLETVSKLQGADAQSLPLWQDAISRLVPSISAYDEIIKEHNTTLGEYTNRLQNGTLTLSEYDDLVAQLLTETSERLSTESNLTDAQREEIVRLRSSRNQYVATPQLEGRDTTYDYKKTDLEKQQETLTLLQGYIKELEKAIELGSTESLQYIATAKAKATSLEELIKLETIRNDLATLQDKRAQQTYQGVKQIASATRGATRAFRQLRSVFEDEDTTGIEKIFAAFSSIVSVVDSILSLVRAFKALSATMEAVSDASTALQTAETATQATSIATMTAEIATTKALQAAKLSEMATAISARYALIPGGQALAATEIAGYAALIASVKGLAGFATGGLVDFGDPIGDRTLIRVNRGERVLTSEHQQWLERLAQGMHERTEPSSAQRVEVTGQLRVKGRDLVTVLHNETRQSKR